MKISYIVFVLLMAGSSCNKSDTGNCTPERKEYTFQAGKQIDHQKRVPADTAFEYYSYSIKDGNKNVFNFTWHRRDCREIADDEGARIIIFEVPQDVNSFQIKDSADLRNAKAIINYACYCNPSGPLLVNGGYIEGEKKSNNRWHIKASLIVLPHLSDRLDFEGDFILN